ncbi:MAG TPA: hypothetical protein PLY87_29315, partial [Planctomycetaceae bacterium]|nr:hypothetical protein [Planctomycetaceae bacterium]
MKTFDHRIAKTFGAWMPFIVCFTLGCGGTDMPSAATSLIVVDGEANSVNDAAAPMELFFFIADGLSSDIRQNLKTHLGSLLKTLPGGSIIQVVRTPDHRAMATLVIPHTTGRERLRDKSLTLGLTPVIALLQDNGVVPEDFRGQLSLDQLATTFWGLRASDHKCRITLVGTPIYHDPDLAQWNFGTTRFPSDSSLTHPDSTLPFRRHGRNAIPSDVEVVWILPKDDWGNGKLREDAILRFYRQAFVLGIGGDFLRMTSDMDAAFER